MNRAAKKQYRNAPTHPSHYVYTDIKKEKITAQPVMKQVGWQEAFNKLFPNTKGSFIGIKITALHYNHDPD